MTLGFHRREHQKLREGVNFTLNNNAFSIGAGGNFSTLEDAVAVAGDRLTLVNTFSANIAIFAASTTIVGTGTTWRTNKQLRVGDLLQIAGDTTKFHKVLEVATDTSITLGGGFDGTQIFPSAVTQIEVFRIDWASLILLPGQHVSPDTGISLTPGLAICGLEKYSTILSEIDSAPPAPFINFGENILSNFTLGPTDAWSDLDGIQSSPSTSLWGGAVSIMDNMFIRCKDTGGDHGNGAGGLHVPSGGRSIVNNCEIEFELLLQVNHGGRVTPTVNNTKIEMRNTTLRQVKSWWSYGGAVLPLPPTALRADKAITYNLDDCTILIDHNADMSSTFDDPTGIHAVGAGIINLNRSRIRANNGQTISGINCPASSTATVNVTNSDIEVLAGSGTGKGILTEDAGATVNVRGSRVKGNTNSLHAVAGTINYDTASTLLGTNTGGTALNT